MTFESLKSIRIKYWIVEIAYIFSRIEMNDMFLKKC